MMQSCPGDVRKILDTTNAQLADGFGIGMGPNVTSLPVHLRHTNSIPSPELWPGAASVVDRGTRSPEYGLRVTEIIWHRSRARASDADISSHLVGSEVKESYGVYGAFITVGQPAPCRYGPYMGPYLAAGVLAHMITP